MEPIRYDPVRRLRLSIGMIALLLLAGTGGYMLIENFTVIEALYMTVITLSTVGFTEVKELSPHGRLFTIGLIGCGVGMVAYAVSLFSEIMIESNLIRQRRREGRIAKMNDHIIICGFGRIGEQVAHRLATREVPFVIVELDPSNITRLEQIGHPYIAGDAREDVILARAGVHHARSLVAALRDDSDNVYAILAARALNPKLYIVARAGSKGSEDKIRLAGADRVISPYEIGSHYVINALLRPSVLAFMDFVAELQADKKKNLEIDEIHVPEQSPIAGMLLQNTNIRSERNVIVLAIKHPDGTIMYNPPSSHVIKVGETLICIGYAEQLDLLAAEVKDARPRN